MLWYHATLYRRCNTLGYVWLRLWGWKKAVEITWCENHPHFSVCRCGIPWPRHCKFSKAVWTVKVRKSMPPLSYRGFTSIESGIGVAEFTSLDRDLPGKVVTQGLKIFCKYTGQLITCYRLNMWLKTARSSPHVSIIYTWRIMFSPPHLTPLIPRKCKKYRWKRLVQKILMMKFPRALAARRYRRRQTYILGLFLTIFSLSQTTPTFPS